MIVIFFFFFQAEDGIRDWSVTGVQTCALPISVLPADSATLARLTADLAYPNSSQRFFKAGNDQIEQEIQRLLADDPPDSFLTIAPEIQEQFEE